jgi:hypothetical protein
LQFSIEVQLLINKGYGPENIEMVQKYQGQVIGFREQIMLVSLGKLSVTQWHTFNVS